MPGCYTLARGKSMRLIFLFMTLIPVCAFAQKDPQIEALMKRIELLEKQQEEILLNQDQNSNQVNSFLKDNLTFGGFFESAITTMNGPDMRFQMMPANHFLGLNIAADFNDNLHFVTQLLSGLVFPVTNQHNDPRNLVTPQREFGTAFFGSILTQGYLEFSRSSNARIQTGLGYVPFGYYPQQRELVLFVRRGGPQLLRTTDLIAPLWTGVHLSGNLDSTRSGYHLYTTTTLDDTNVMGLGGRLWANSYNDSITGGLSSQVVKYEGHTGEILGADIRMHLDRWVITSEYAIHMTEGKDPWTAYIEPTFRITEEYLIYTFADYAQSTRNETTSLIKDPFNKWEYGGGINWLPTAFTRLRAGVTFNDYVGSREVIRGQERDYISFDLSAGVAF